MPGSVRFTSTTRSSSPKEMHDVRSPYTAVGASVTARVADHVRSNSSKHRPKINRKLTIITVTVYTFFFYFSEQCSTGKS